MKQVFNYDKQKVVRRNNVGEIKSIKPINEPSTDPINIINPLIQDLKQIAAKYPSVKLQFEINNIREGDYDLIKQDLSWSGSYTDQGKRSFYQPSLNGVIILHKEI